MNNIYEIDSRIAEILNGSVNEETGEVEFNVDELEKLGMEREQICEALCLMSKNDMAFIEALKKEVESLNERIRKKENRMESRNEYIKHALGGQKFETPKVKASFRTTHDVVNFDIKESEFQKFAVEQKLFNILKESTTYKVSKTAIKEALKKGEKIPHAFLQDSISMTLT